MTPSERIAEKNPSFLLPDWIARQSGIGIVNAQAHFQNRTVSFDTLLRQSGSRLMQIFRENGLRPGDKVALLLPNSPLFVAAYYAVLRFGAMAVPCNPLLKPAELEYIWRDADVRLVVTFAPLVPNTEAARHSLPAMPPVLALDLMAALEDAPNAAAPHEAGVQQETTDDENQGAVIIYTSGTTGKPKGAMLSHRNLRRNVEQVQARLHLRPDDVFLTLLPLFHSFAATVCMNCAFAVGASSVLLENFAPARVFEAIEKYGVTIFPAVPAIFNALLHFAPDREYNLSSLRMFVSGGAALPDTLLQAMEARFGVPVLEGYGPTECSPVVSVNPLAGPRKIGSVGPALPGVEVAIFDEADAALPFDTVGEIVVRGDNVMLGYLNQPDATAEAMRSGWYHTGDMGTLDADGYIRIVDRKKDMIITAGLNVYPREVEETLRLHPAVADCAVIGQGNAARGEEVVAVVVLKPDAALSERELIAHCRALLANYKVPRRVLFRAALPLGGTGKVVKRLLKAELEAESGGER